MKLQINQYKYKILYFVLYILVQKFVFVNSICEKNTDT